MSIITHILYTLFLLIERQKIILSENKFDYLIASILVNIIEREWHLTDVYNTNKVLFDILLNVNRCRRCFHKFLSNMTLVISFFLSIFLYICHLRPMSQLYRKKKNWRRTKKKRKKKYRRKQNDDKEYLYVFIYLTVIYVK